MLNAFFKRRKNFFTLSFPPFVSKNYKEKLSFLQKRRESFA